MAGIILIILLILALAVMVAGRCMLDYTLRPKAHGQDPQKTLDKAEERYPGIRAWYTELLQQGAVKDTVITGEGGVPLHAAYFPAAEPDSARGTAIVIHGYTNNHLVFLNLGRMYRDTLNFNVLMPDLQYHGLSGGRTVQMGWKDRLDVLKWVEAAHGIWQDDFMVIHGVSMGGATTMMLSGEPTPEYVRAFVEDCGYSSVWTQLKHNLHQSYHLPPWPLLHAADWWCRRVYGWSFKEASSARQLASCTKPMLFIHGDSDDFVPTSDAWINYDAKASGLKEIWIVPQTAHAAAYAKFPQQYTDRVRTFLDKVKENH